MYVAMFSIKNINVAGHAALDPRLVDSTTAHVSCDEVRDTVYRFPPSNLLFF
jgi:hypothetical protein